ncbi:hypothetical protein ACFCV8_31325, partial [Streptomyces sp. NPDC056347]
MDADGYDRGAYGVTIAVPGENACYQAFSPATYVSKGGATRKAEQRSAVCATVPSRAAMFCAAHFSTGGDLNVSPPARGHDTLTTMYDRYQECAEKDGVYDGPSTKDGEEIDYIFSPYSFSACISRSTARCRCPRSDRRQGLRPPPPA